MKRLRDPEVAWSDDGTPRSRRFDDVYFVPGNGPAETRHVFFDGIGALEVWRGRDRFVVAETGFGSGLNFLAAWRLWRQTAAPAARLHYVSAEGLPLAPADIVRAHAGDRELATLAKRLAAGYPARHPGFHRIEFDGGRVSLLLLFGPIEAVLGGLVARADAWFLDGFAPSRNPEMWTDAVFHAIAERSAEGARLATFTAAGRVRRGLQAAGFAVEKRPGFGSKRECLCGHFAGPPARPAVDPWFQPAAPLGEVAEVAVIGAAVARALTEGGLTVRVFDRAERAGGGASGNPLGLLQPRAGGADNPYGRFQTAAFPRATRCP